ncbi:hypothetical protein F5876DRAFT_74673 [Lentinula aff. lateritia]|uniref:Uncharacterized protein n=1 Tax=Lentinula aff. lateritia TaxID=2804960 RepID=A0ACC1U6N0_9AGAR|nr:hypothetical protein F5876DRAFT_74673 [Lentinula aff. lateritia]
MSFHHSRISLSFKLSFIFVFGLVCAAFAVAMPLSRDEPVAVFIPSSNVDATTISRRDDLKSVCVKVSYTTDPTLQEHLSPAPVSAKLQRYLDVVSKELGFIASISELEGVPYRRNGAVVDFVMVVMMSTPVRSYTGQMGVTSSTVKDIPEEKLTTLRLTEQDGGRKIMLKAGAIHVISPIN